MVDRALNANFLSATFAGMVVGAWLAGVCGDHFGRRFSYQINLLVFGLAALAGALAPQHGMLIAARFVMGVGLGAEIVVGYATMSEFVPPAPSRALVRGARHDHELGVVHLGA
ncbi:MAG: MFS transporter [Pseudomonadota bacterium]